MKRGLRLGILVLCVAVGAIGCGGVSSPELDATAAVEEHVEAEVEIDAVHPDEWFVYASCPKAVSCTAELSYNGAPGAAMGTNHYRVIDGEPELVGKNQIHGVLRADREKGCTDRYLETEDVGYLIPCSYGT